MQKNDSLITPLYNCFKVKKHVPNDWGMEMKEIKRRLRGSWMKKKKTFTFNKANDEMYTCSAVSTVAASAFAF